MPPTSRRWPSNSTAPAWHRPMRRRHLPTCGRRQADSAILHWWMRHILCPTLQPGDIVLWEHLSAHSVAGVEGLLEAHGARLLRLSPYAPDFNSIEQCWSKWRWRRPLTVSPATLRCQALPINRRTALHSARVPHSMANNLHNLSQYTDHCDTFVILSGYPRSDQHAL